MGPYLLGLARQFENVAFVKSINIFIIEVFRGSGRGTALFLTNLFFLSSHICVQKNSHTMNWLPRHPSPLGGGSYYEEFWILIILAFEIKIRQTDRTDTELTNLAVSKTTDARSANVAAKSSLSRCTILKHRTETQCKTSHYSNHLLSCSGTYFIFILRVCFITFVSLHAKICSAKARLHCAICDCDLFLLVMNCVGVSDVITVTRCEHFH